MPNKMTRTQIIQWAIGVLKMTNAPFLLYAVDSEDGDERSFASVGEKISTNFGINVLGAGVANLIYADRDNAHIIIRALMDCVNHNLSELDQEGKENNHEKDNQEKPNQSVH